MPVVHSILSIQTHQPIWRLVNWNLTNIQLYDCYKTIQKSKLSVCVLWAVFHLFVQNENIEKSIVSIVFFWMETKSKSNKHLINILNNFLTWNDDINQKKFNEFFIEIFLRYKWYRYSPPTTNDKNKRHSQQNRIDAHLLRLRCWKQELYLSEASDFFGGKKLKNHTWTEKPSLEQTHACI